MLLSTLHSVDELAADSTYRGNRQTYLMIRKNMASDFRVDFNANITAKR
jgi:hypothetical protein